MLRHTAAITSSAIALSMAALMMGSASAATLPSMNLTSTKHTVAAGSLPNFQSATITVGSRALRVGSGTQLTPAEAIALQQVLQSGHQSLIIGRSGNATGGLFTMDGSSQQGSDLILPKGVIGIDTFSTDAGSVFSGNLVNGGTLYAVSSNVAVTSVAVQANNITNLHGGTISTILPNGLTATKPATDMLALSLTANGAFANYGVIKSIGALTFNSGKSILNTGVIAAQNDITLNAGGGLTNNGLICSTAGNVTFSAPAVAKVDVKSTGTIEALVGSISFVGQGTSQWTFQGGNYLSRELNFNLGGGSGTAKPAEVTGVVDATADNMYLQMNVPSLRIGTWNVTGKPVVLNTGNVWLESIVTNGAPIVVLSQQNITSAAQMHLCTASANGPSGDITLLAGAKYTFDKSGNVVLHGKASAGGIVDCSLSSDMSIDTSSDTGAGGTVNIGAFAGNGNGSGRVLLPATYDINTCSGNGKPSGLVCVNADTPVSATVIGDDDLVIDTETDASNG